MTWFYEGEAFTSEMIEDNIGYVYEIENIETGKSYIGKKLFRFTKTTRTKKKKKRVVTESDWQSYWGSSDSLLEHVREVGEDKFKRTIVRLCKTKTELGYHELRMQMVNDVLLKPDKYFNNYIGYRAHRKNLIKGYK